MVSMCSHPEPPSHLPPHHIPLGHPSAPAPSTLYPASDLDWRLEKRNQRSNCQCLLEYRKSKGIPKTSTSASLTMLKPLTMWITTNCKILKEMGVPDLLTCLLRNLYASKEAMVRGGHGTTDWFQIGKGVG